MAVPNIAAVATLQGRVVMQAVTNSAVLVDWNYSGTSTDVEDEHLYKINTILISNIDGTNSADISITISATSGGTYFHICKTVPVPADSTLSVLDAPLYLPENYAMKVEASASSDLEAVISFEDIVD